MTKFYSSLSINFKRHPGVHQVFRPRYNREFFKRATQNLELLKSHVERRCKTDDFNLSAASLHEFRENSSRMIQARQDLVKLTMKRDGDSEDISRLNSRVEALEDQVMPFAIRIPNRVGKNVPDVDSTIEELESRFGSREKLGKVLSHRKLAHINGCYSKSVVGPNSHYYIGIGANLQHGLSSFFHAELEKANFIPVSGLCLVKSAVVEASNASDNKDYMYDPCRVLWSNRSPTTSHLVEASRESLVAFLTTVEALKSNNTLRFMTRGSAYREGSNWFDGDDKNVTQFETIHALMVTPSIEYSSVKEFEEVKCVLWNIYKKLGLPSRLVHCSIDRMHSNEYDSYRIDVWIPSRHQWIQVGRISHYLDYITVRTGRKRGHIIDSTAYDSQSLIAAILENNQTPLGRFIIPPVIKEHMLDMSETEISEYFPVPHEHCRDNADGQKPNVWNSLEQRRYLVKRSYRFGHSKKAKRGNEVRYHREIVIPFVFFGACAIVIDWGEFWIQTVPDFARRFLYDHVYRPSRRIKWRLIYDNKNCWPQDLSYDEIDKSSYGMSMLERKRDEFQKTPIEGIKRFRDPKTRDPPT